MVKLLGRRPYAYICYDLFLNERDERVRAEIDRSLERPIHEVTKSGNTYHLRRNKRMDEVVAASYTNMHSLDKGPRPYFSDSMYPTV